MLSLTFFACKSEKARQEEPKQGEFRYLLEQFADLKVMAYQVPGFDELTLNQKKLIYYLSEAALCGRDIIFDQNFKENLCIRRTLEEVVKHYKGDKNSEDFKNFMVYTKRVWFSNGIHHHYSSDKIMPGFMPDYFAALVKNSEGANWPVRQNESVDDLVKRLTSIMFDPSIASKKISLDPGKDLIAASSCNYYEGVTEKEVEAFYGSMKDPKDTTPVSYGLNSKVVKENGRVKEKVYKVGGMYGPALEKIVYWLEQAMNVAENDRQQAALALLIEYYKTGDLEKFDEFNIAWVKDLDSRVDFVNGFTEVYGDPLGLKASWESVVNFKDLEATKRTEVISRNAQWFEDNSPIDPRFKKKEVKGVSAKVITVAQLGGDCYPSTPIGINLPNADWIRKEYGSKSVTMDNITYAYDQAALGNGFLEEFCYTPEEVALAKKWQSLADNLHTDMHECLGHGSGQLLPGTSSEALKNYQSALEEARADLFALYYLMDQKMIDLGVMPEMDVAKVEYDRYIRNGLLTQLTRIELGKDIEQAHMRSRQLIAGWCFDRGKPGNVIEMVKKEGKTYVRITDYNKLRGLFGDLLKEIQRIKSEGDYKAGSALVESYAVKVDPVLHKEIRERFEKLHIAPYGGFVNPVLVPVYENEEIIDVKIEYVDDYTRQMLEYSEKYSYLPTYN
jgi:dipeptidyl-peptidase-3